MFLELKEYFRNMFNYSGRTRRREYWVPSLWITAVSYIVYGITYAAFVQCINFATGDFDPKPVAIVIGCIFGLISIVLYLATLLANISASVRRCHDIGYPGYVFLFCILGSFVCGIGSIVWLVFCCLDSKEDNQWGPNPKTAEPEKYTSNASIIGSIIAFVAGAILYTIIVFMSAFIPALGSYQQERPIQQYGNDYGYCIEATIDKTV